MIKFKGKDRNKKCWCGSGKKYKKCHFDKENLEKPKMWDIDKVIKEHKSKKMCMVNGLFNDNCNNIIEAHTVSKSSNLKLIARKGHVYSYKPTIIGINKSNGKIGFEEVGINKASAFNGFCGYHDNILFSPLEDRNFEGSFEQLFLLSFRALCKEHYNKINSNNLYDDLRSIDSGMNINEQIIFQNKMKNMNLSNNLACNDLKEIFKDYNYTIINKNYSNEKYVYLYIELDLVPPIMCSGSIFPHYDFQGKLIQNLSDTEKLLNEIVFNSISIGSGKGAFTLFGRKTNASINFIKSFNQIPNEHKVFIFMYFLFMVCENIFINPDWWDNLDENIKNMIIDQININLFSKIDAKYLMPNVIIDNIMGINKINSNF